MLNNRSCKGDQGTPTPQSLVRNDGSADLTCILRREFTSPFSNLRAGLALVLDRDLYYQPAVEGGLADKTDGVVRYMLVGDDVWYGMRILLMACLGYATSKPNPSRRSDVAHRGCFAGQSFFPCPGLSVSRVIRDRNELSAVRRSVARQKPVQTRGPMAVLPGTTGQFASSGRPGDRLNTSAVQGQQNEGEKAVVYLGNVGILAHYGVQKYADPIARVKTNRGKPGARRGPLIAGRKPCPQCYRTVWVCTVFCPPSVLSSNQGILLELHSLLDIAFGPAPTTTIEGLHPLALLARLESPPRHPRVAHTLGRRQTRILSGHTTGQWPAWH